MAFFLYGFFVVLLIVLGILFIGLYLLGALMGGLGNVWNLLRKLTGWERAEQPRTAKSSSSRSDGPSSRPSSSRASGEHHRGEKMFGDNEGTYVDFEEVKS